MNKRLYVFLTAVILTVLVLNGHIRRNIENIYLHYDASQRTEQILERVEALQREEDIESRFETGDEPLYEKVPLAPPPFVTEPAEVQTGNRVLLDDWYRLLQAAEEIYGGTFRVLEEMEAYAQDSTWENLLKARASCSAALVALRQMELPKPQMTQEMIDGYADAGVEINVLLREFDALESTHSSMCDTVMLLCYTLEDDVYLKTTVETTIPAMVEFYREYFRLEYGYLSQYSNYLLLEIRSEAEWDKWIALPWLSVCADPWRNDSDEIMAATERTLDRIQALQTEMGSVLGLSEYTLELVQEAVDTGELDALRRELNRHGDMPGCFPTPQWLPDVVHLYMVMDPQTQQKRLVRAGEKLTEAPAACYISCGVIEQEQVEAYVRHLQDWGIPCYGIWEDAEEAFQVVAKSGESSMMIKWTPEETLIYLTEPVGGLIPELYFSLLME